MTGSALSPGAADVSELRASVGGALLTAASSEYEQARRIENGGIDRRPALIAQCRSEGDVAAVLGWGLERDLPVSVRGSGHGVHGRALCDGVVIDMRGLSQVDVDGQRRIARVGGGASWGDVYPAVAAHGLGAVGGTVGSVGVAGLIIGGGFGWLTRRYGYASDNVESFDLLTADGRVRHVDAAHYSDLFWALLGGGGVGLGVILATTLRLHEVPQRVLAGRVMYDAGDAAAVLHAYTAFMREADRDTNAIWVRMQLPDAPALPALLRGRAIVMVALCRFGIGGAAETALAPMREVAPVLVDDVHEMSYAEMQTIMQEGIPTGLLNFWLSSFLSALPEEGAAAMLDAAQHAPGVPVQLWQMGSAIAERTDDESMVGRAGRNYFIGSPTMWADPTQSAQMRVATRAVASTTASWRVASCPNHSGAFTPEELIESFGEEKLARLRDVKARYDPSGVFTGGLGALGEAL